MTKDGPLSPSEWFRDGRGRRRNFFALDSEVLDIVRSARIEPALVVTVDRREVNGQTLDVPCIQELGSDVRIRTAPRRLWLLPEALRSFLVPEPGTPPGAFYAINGLVVVMFGFPDRKGATWESSVSLVDRVQNESTGEIRQHERGLRMFRAIDRELKSRLGYASVFSFADGSTYEDAHRVLMTDRAAEAARDSAIKFAVRPGTRVTRPACRAK
jgi:hypothetical protein